MKMFARFGIIAVTGIMLLTSMVAPAQAAIVAQWNFENDNTIATGKDGSVSMPYSPSALGIGVTTPGITHSAAIPMTSQGVTTTTTAGSITDPAGPNALYENEASTPSLFSTTPSSTNYFEFTLTGAASISTLSLDFKKTFTGLAGVEVRSSLDGYTANALIGLVGTAQTTYSQFNSGNLSLINPGYNSISGPITFRIYVTDVDSLPADGDRDFIDNIRLEGSTVPEPASLLAWTVFASVGSVLAYRRRKVS